MTVPGPVPGPAVLASRRRVSVLIPAYNHADYVAEAIASVLAQDWPDIELRLLDDGSDDETLARAERAVAGQSRVRCVVESQSNAGVSPTLNRLMERADGDLIAILNSDDRFAPGRLRRFAEAANGPSSTDRPFFGFSAVAFIDGGTDGDRQDFADWYAEALDKATALPTAGFALLLANLAVSSSNFVFSRDLAARVGGFDSGLPLTQDWDFALRCARLAEPVFVPEPLLDYRVHPANTWRRLRATRVEQIVAVLRRHFAATAPAENPLAPVPAAWPRFLPIFLAVARPVFTTESLARVLADAAISLPPAGADATSPLGAMERTAIARLASFAGKPAGARPDPDAAARAAALWAAARATVAP